MLNFQKLKHICQSLDITQLITVGYSGGVDSHVLLHALNKLVLDGMPLKLQAIHVNHHLNSAADQWVVHCQKMCDVLKVPLIVLDVHLENTQGESLEALARTARYEVIANALPENSYFLTAHHQQDQAETVLLQLLRGAGPKGLSAMPFEKKFKHIHIIRPLLEFSREVMLDYAHENQLTWIEDSSNLNTDFQRNYLRQEVMPILKKVWPGCAQTLARSADHCAEAEGLIETLAEQDLKHCIVNNKWLSILALQRLSIPRIKQAVRYWLTQHDFNLPPTTKLHQIITEVLPAQVDTNPLIAWEGVEIRRYRDVLYAMKPLMSIASHHVLPWDFSKPLVLPNELGILIATKTTGQGIDVAKINGYVDIRFRQGGETCRLQGRAGTRALKNLFQDWGVPTWQRDRIPLIYYQNQLVCVVGFCVCEGFVVNENSQGFVIAINYTQRS